MGSADREDQAAIRAWLDAKGRWFALADGERVPVGLRWGVLSVVDLGELSLTSGSLGACDPYVFLEGCETWVELPPGRYPVKLTLADISPAHDGSDVVEAYLTLLVDPSADEVRRESPAGRDWGGVGVDAGTVCFVDAQAARRSYAAFEDWENLVQGPGGWFERMDDPSHLGPGRANLPLPGLDDGSNLVLCHSGWGDGIYPVVVGYDGAGRVVRVHVDLGVVGSVPSESAQIVRRPAPTERTKLYALALMGTGTFLLIGLGLWLGWRVEIVVGAALAWTAAAFGWSLYKGWTAL